MDVEAAPLLLSDAGERILELHDALIAFAKIAPRQGRVVELRYFGDLTEGEMAALMNSSQRTVWRDWQFAKAWLQRELSR
jgi:DNA-directed RNA polymerase specialized sigma24 family protein